MVSPVTYLHTTLKSLSLGVASILNLRKAHWTFLCEWPRSFSNVVCPQMVLFHFPAQTFLLQCPLTGQQTCTFPTDPNQETEARVLCSCPSLRVLFIVPMRFANLVLLSLTTALVYSGLSIPFLDCSSVFIVALSLISLSNPLFSNFIFGQHPLTYKKLWSCHLPAQKPLAASVVTSGYKWNFIAWRPPLFHLSPLGFIQYTASRAPCRAWHTVEAWWIH